MSIFRHPCAGILPSITPMQVNESMEPDQAGFTYLSNKHNKQTTNLQFSVVEISALLKFMLMDLIFANNQDDYR